MIRRSHARLAWLAFAFSLVAASSCGGTSVTYLGGSGGTGGSSGSGGTTGGPCSQYDPCGDHGTCNDSGGTLTCICDAGYTGPSCSSCDGGFHPEGGLCVPDSSCLPTTCSGHGTCDDSSGSVICSCDPGYTGMSCSTCAAGYHWEGDECVLNTTCQPTSCSGHGSCDDSSGVAICSCYAGYTGASCNECAGGYHWEGNQCVADQSCLPTTCSGHGTCDDSSGAATCSCYPGYTGTSCSLCAGGYHWMGNVCVPDETCLPNSCSGHGTCDDTGGVISCDCDQGYSGVYCSACAAGFQDNDGDGSCLPSCALANPPCDHGTCSDADGSAGCTCDPGYSGTYCSTCNDDSNENNDMDSTGTYLSGSYSATGLVICPGDEDWFQIHLDESDTLNVTVTFNNSAGNIDLYLWYPFDSPNPDNQVAASQSSTANSESFSYFVPAGEGGTYFIEVKSWYSIRNTYSITVTVNPGPGCDDCTSLGKECGTWDDGCSGTVTCGPCAPTQSCDAYFGVCADNLCELVTGCCAGTTLKTCLFGGQDVWNCATWGQQCGWIADAVTFPGLPGYFACDTPGNLSTPPAGIPLQCPAGLDFPP